MKILCITGIAGVLVLIGCAGSRTRNTSFFRNIDLAATIQVVNADDEPVRATVFIEPTVRAAIPRTNADGVLQIEFDYTYEKVIHIMASGYESVRLETKSIPAGKTTLVTLHEKEESNAQPAHEH